MMDIDAKRGLERTIKHLEPLSVWGPRWAPDPPPHKLDSVFPVFAHQQNLPKYAPDCCIKRVTPYGDGSIMVWGSISLVGKTRLMVFNGTLNVQRYCDEILDPVAIPYVQNMGVGSILEDDNARPHTARIVQDHLQLRGIE